MRYLERTQLDKWILEKHKELVKRRNYILLNDVKNRKYLLDTMLKVKEVKMVHSLIYETNYYSTDMVVNWRIHDLDTLIYEVEGLLLKYHID